MKRRGVNVPVNGLLKMARGGGKIATRISKITPVHLTDGFVVIEIKLMLQLDARRRIGVQCGTRQ
jgi:hypothetical protein